MYFCALSLAVALLADPTTAGTATQERQLYQAAATAIEQRDLPVATELLEQLLREHADGEVAEVAAFHLAECLWLQQRPQPALAVLAQWCWRIERLAAADSRHANLAANTAVMLAQILERLQATDDILAMLDEMLSTADAQRSPMLTLALAIELSRRYQISGDYRESQLCLQRVVDATAAASDDRPLSGLTDTLRTRLNFELPLAWAAQELSQGDAEAAVEILEQLKTAELSSDQTLAVRFLLAEAFFAAGRQAAAEEQFQWLAEQAAVASPKPPWMAAIALRRGELLLRRRDFSAAQQWLQQAQREHADFARAYEFDYLLARCAVARIEFDEAQDRLQSVIDAPAAQATEAVPRAAWMLGEVHFLRRQFSQALEAYARVASMHQFPEWQARGLLQSAKCHELLGQTAQALAEYQQALKLSQQPEVQRPASERVAALQAFAGELR